MKRFTYIAGASLSLLFIVSLAQAITISKSLALFYSPSPAIAFSEEFVGPFPSWLNVQTGCGGAGAIGNGTTDDTAAIQRCLTALSPSTPVVYFPAASVNYKISSSLTVTGQQNVMIIGENPASTVIKWAGSSGGTMMAFGNNANSRVIRVAFDGNNVADTGVSENYNGSGNYFDQGNLYTDVVFKNFVNIAFYCGLTAGCADIPIIRGQFLNNGMGAFVGNQNALDLNIWYSVFQNNTYAGAGNYYAPLSLNGGGSFNVFSSNFFGSGQSDNVIANPLYNSFRNNYSIGSNYFVNGGGSCGDSSVTLQNNMILDPVTGAHNLSDRGPLLLLDNNIRSSANPTVSYGSCATGDALSLGNTFTSGTITSDCSGSSPIKVKAGVASRCRSVTELGGGDKVVSTGTFNATVNTAVPILPPTPPNYNRTIYETNPSTGTNNNTCSLASPCTIQAAVCKAATGSNGFSAGACTGTVAPSRAVVHLVPSNYTVSTTIAVPASDIQIIGDGFFSQIVGSGLSSAPVIKLAGPSHVVLRDFAINGSAHTADGIEIDGADQAGGLVFGQLINIGDYTASGLFSDSMNNAVIEMHSFILNENTTTSTNGGIRVVGGGANAGAQTNILDLLATGNYLTFNVSSDGRLIAEDCWCASEGEHLYAGLSGHHLATVTGSGVFTYANGIDLTYALPADPTFAVSNFTGSLAYAGGITTGEMTITGTGTGANNLAIGAVNYWRGEDSATQTSGSKLINNFSATNIPASVGTGQWVIDYCNAPAIPSSLVTPSTVSSLTATSITMSQNATAGVNNCGGSGRDQIAFYAATPYSDTSGSTNGYLNPLTQYLDGIAQADGPQELPEIGSSGTTFLTTALSQLRSTKPRLPQYQQPTITNVEMYNLQLIFLVNAIHIKP